MAEQIPVTLSVAEVEQLLPDNAEIILVAGQALATWVDALAIELPKALEAGVTRDYDYLGSKKAAEEHFRLLSIRGLRVELIFPQFGDITPNTAKLLVKGDADQIKAEVDYLGSLCGFLGADEERLRSRAIPVLFGEQQSTIKVMHPYDCLKSRVHNLANLPAKRNPLGVAQTELAIKVVRKFLERALGEGESSVRDVVFPLVEALIDLAASRDGVHVFHEYGIDLLGAIDSEKMPEVFKTKRWPRANDYVYRRRFGRRRGRT